MSTEWPRIDGIDIEEVRRLLQDDYELFAEVAIEFLDENNSISGSLDALLLGGDADASLKFLHRLRGQAASIAAMDLVASIRVLEAIHKGEAQGDATAAAETIQHNFKLLDGNLRAAL